MKPFLAVLSLMFLIAHDGFSFQNSADSKDSARVESQGLLPVPIAYYTPETGIAGGAGVLYFIRPEGSSPGSRPSANALMFIYTEKRQFIAQYSGEWYFQDGQYRMDNDLLFMRYPQKFFGIGNKTSESAEEDYTSQLFRYEFKAIRAVAEGFNVGLTGFFENRKVSDLMPGGVLESGTIFGSNDGITSGAGPMMTLDSRDNIFAPEHGTYHMISVVAFDKIFGSDYQFTKTVINLRKYWLVADQQVIAAQLYGSFVFGAAPFHKLAELGGQSMMRGYYEGRYRDKHYLTAQAEYRAPLFWRIGLVVFGGLGDVAHEIGQFNVRDLKPTYGIGFRYYFSLQERLNLRVDFGFGNNSSGVYIGPQESF